jgi:hypothetical protein
MEKVECGAGEGGVGRRRTWTLLPSSRSESRLDVSCTNTPEARDSEAISPKHKIERNCERKRERERGGRGAHPVVEEGDAVGRRLDAHLPHRHCRSRSLGNQREPSGRTAARRADLVLLLRSASSKSIYGGCLNVGYTFES